MNHISVYTPLYIVHEGTEGARAFRNETKQQSGPVDLVPNHPPGVMAKVLDTDFLCLNFYIIVVVRMSDSHGVTRQSCPLFVK